MKRTLTIMTVVAFVLAATAVSAQTTTTAPAAKPAAPTAAPAVKPVAAAPAEKVTAPAATTAKTAEEPKALAEKACKAKNLAGAAYDECMKTELAKAEKPAAPVTK